MGNFKKRLSKFKKSLTRFNDDEPLSKISLAIIILLDFFILSVIFEGLSDHTSQLASPYDYFPYECRQIFIRTSWTGANKMFQLQKLILQDYNQYSYTYDKMLDKNKIQKMHPVCQNFYRLVKSVYENSELKSLFIKRQSLIKERHQYKTNFKESNEVYNTSLLEKIADKNTNDLDAVSKSAKTQSQKIDRINSDITGIDRQISKHHLIIALWNMIKPGNESFRQEIINDINSYDRKYLFKELMWQLLFMLPLFFIFFFWHSRNVKRNNKIQLLISSHLLVVASIPIVLKIINLVLELIPKHFFKELFKILEQFHIIALWHYVVILVSIFAVILFIYLIQKKIFNKKRLYQKRLMKGACYQCGKVLPQKDEICPFCGANQLRKCPNCNADTYVAGEYCVNCGKP